MSFESPKVEMLGSMKSSFADFDLMAASAMDWDQKYNQINRGKFAGSMAQAVLTTLQLGRESWSPGVIVEGSAPKGSWVIAFPIVAAGSLHLRGREIASGQPLVIGPCDDLAFTANGNTDLAMAVIPAERIHSWSHMRRDASGLNSLDRRPWKIDEHDMVRRGATLSKLLNALMDYGESKPPDMVLAAIEDQVLEVALGMVPSTLVEEPMHRRASVALKLRDLLNGNLEVPYSICKMCELLGVKERTLYLACMEVFGRPPKRLLLELRLNAVRRALANPFDKQTTVTAAASNFGFWHLGEFSAVYKRQFGETPSATLAKAA